MSGGCLYDGPHDPVRLKMIPGSHTFRSKPKGAMTEWSTAIPAAGTAIVPVCITIAMQAFNFSLPSSAMQQVLAVQVG